MASNGGDYSPFKINQNNFLNPTHFIEFRNSELAGIFKKPRNQLDFMPAIYLSTKTQFDLQMAYLRNFSYFSRILRFWDSRF